MEFKGTKGKRHVYYNSQGYNSFSINSKYKVVPIEEMKANDLLISKAPEMLDFINRISGEMLRNDFVLDERWYEQARKLIKQATEI